MQKQRERERRGTQKYVTREPSDLHACKIVCTISNRI
jgi:hypothetical protein